MEIKRVNMKVEELLRGATYLGSGASKEAYLKDDVVYKVPRGRMILQDSEFIDNLHFPDTIDEVDEFLAEVCDWEEQMVWPLGQFVIELIVWNALKDLENQGLSIDIFARIEDYFITSDGVLVIKQESAPMDWADFDNSEDQFEDLLKEIDLLEPILVENYNISLRDVREGNCGYTEDGHIKLFDFGISTTTSLDSYGSYSDYNSYDSYEDEYYNEDEENESETN